MAFLPRWTALHNTIPPIPPSGGLFQTPPCRSGFPDDLQALALVVLEAVLRDPRHGKTARLPA